jgi:hypothetical protein
MLRCKMLNEDICQPAGRVEMFDELLDGFQASCRRADANNDLLGGFVLL